MGQIFKLALIHTAECINEIYTLIFEGVYQIQMVLSQNDFSKEDSAKWLIQHKTCFVIEIENHEFAHHNAKKQQQQN